MIAPMHARTPGLAAVLLVLAGAVVCAGHGRLSERTHERSARLNRPGVKAA